MSISNTVGGFSKYLNKIRTAPLYADIKKEIHNILNVLPVFGKPVEKHWNMLLSYCEERCNPRTDI